VKQKKQRIQYIAPPPRVKKKVEEETVAKDALYKVTVFTGDVSGASTDASVSVLKMISCMLLNNRCGGNRCFVVVIRLIMHH
jgi:hypothetical protein